MYVCMHYADMYVYMYTFSKKAWGRQGVTVWFILHTFFIATWQISASYCGNFLAR